MSVADHSGAGAGTKSKTAEPVSAEALLGEAVMYLRALTSLNADRLTGGLSQTAQVQRLVDAGLDSTAIVAVTGIRMTTVSPIVSKYRRGKSEG